MKTDVKVHFVIDDNALQIHVDQVDDVPVDLGNTNDYNDVVTAVENFLYQKYHAILCIEEDYVVDNAHEIYEKLSL